MSGDRGASGHVSVLSVRVPIGTGKSPAIIPDGKR